LSITFRLSLTTTLKQQGGGVINLIPFFSESKQGFPANERWKNILSYLENHGDEYNQVLIADTRDVIFQGDVFECFAGEKNYLGYTVEADDILAVKSGGIATYNWIRDCFGNDEADKLSDKEIICCGTVIGTVKEMKIFLKLMSEYVFNLKNLHFTGDDQAVENYIIYNNLLPVKNLIKIDCHSGAILTSDLFHGLYSIQLRDNFILRGDGEIPAVVHQYDRYPELVSLVNEIYRDKNFEGNFKFTDAKSSFEQMLSLLFAKKFEHALNFAVNILNSPHVNEKTFLFCGFGDYFEYLFDLWGVIINKFQRPSTTRDVLEVAIQNIVMLIFTNIIKSPQAYQLHIIAKFVLSSMQARHTVSENFKLFIAGHFFVLINHYFAEKQFELCLQSLNIVEKFNIPLNKNFYALKAHVYIYLGMKEEAVQTIEKHL